MPEIFDYVVVGGGSAGCVVASRLSEDPKVTVCLLEAGPSDWSPMVHIPLGADAMMPTSHMKWQFESEPQPGLNGRRSYQPRGKVLGGSSSINGMVYARGHRWDYDNWAAMGAKGWSFKDVLPYFRKSEDNAIFEDEFHARGGPVHVSQPATPSKPTLAFLAAIEQLQLPRTRDFNGERQEGFCLLQTTTKNGRRCSTAKAYLTPARKRSNLRIVTGARASRVVFDGRHVSGVEYLNGGGQARRVDARREVILSAGAYQSPQILMLSGVGPSQHLQSHAIKVIHDLPGVGQNLHDHIDYCAPFTSRSTDLVGFSVSGLAHAMGEMVRYAFTRRGLFASNLAEAGGYLSTKPGLVAPDIQYHFITSLLEDHLRKIRWGHGFSIHTNVCRPKSRGSLRLRSADPRAAPMIDLGFFQDAEDIETLLAGFKLIRRVVEASPLRDYVLEDLYTNGIDSDDELKAVLRNKGETGYHPVGSCSMGETADAVVDSRLRVHGLKGLRVVDASVMPAIPGANTNAPTIMIAEKASDMIKADAHD